MHKTFEYSVELSRMKPVEPNGLKDRCFFVIVHQFSRDKSAGKLVNTGISWCLDIESRQNDESIETEGQNRESENCPQELKECPLKN